MNPQSREESLAVLDRHKAGLTAKQYKIVKSVIGNHAIEDMFATESEIDRMVRRVKGEITEEQAMTEIDEVIKLILASEQR